MDFFGIISFIHDIKVRTPDLVALFQEFFSMRDIMDRMWGDLPAGDDLLISINGDRGFQKPFSRFTGSPRIVVAGVRAGEPG